jgi:hypothetical protein
MTIAGCWRYSGLALSSALIVGCLFSPALLSPELFKEIFELDPLQIRRRHIRPKREKEVFLFFQGYLPQASKSIAYAARKHSEAAPFEEPGKANHLSSQSCLVIGHWSLGLRPSGVVIGGDSVVINCHLLSFGCHSLSLVVIRWALGGYFFLISCPFFNRQSTIIHHQSPGIRPGARDQPRSPL